MRRLPNFTRTMVVVLAIGVLVFTSMMYFVSGALARDTIRRVAQEEVQRGLQDGLRLLSAWSAGEADDAALQSAVEPAVNPAGIGLMLLDGENNVLALSSALTDRESALMETITGEASGLQQRNHFLLAWQRGEHGIAAAVKALDAVNAAEGVFRSRMLLYALLGLAFMGVTVLLLALRIMAPVDDLTSAARRISEGEQVEITQKLPVELRSLGRAFNHMSHQLSQSMRDLTHERDTLSQVLESLDEGVLAVDRAGDILRENQAAPRLLGGRSTAAYAQVIAQLRAPGQQEPLTLQVDERTILAVFRPLSDGEGALAVLRDVTEHERLERTRREYVANISHELRTPLSSMRGITEGLRDGLVTDEGERVRCYELLLGEVKRLSRLVNDLLELSNLQSNPAAFETEPVDALESLYELMDRTRGLADQKGVRLALDAPQALPEVVTNEDRLQQVLTILLDNAIKFTPAGGQVTLLARPEGRHVRFSVRDTGIGMDEHTLRHAFDRFHQADPSHGEKGSGLGLAIAQEVMRRLDGHITAKSKPGEGSEFSFLLKTTEEDG